MLSPSPRLLLSFFITVWNFFASAIPIGILGFLRNWVTFAYSAAGGRSKDVLDVMVFRMESRFWWIFGWLLPGLDHDA
jgi:hypothetical protein